MKKKQWDKTVQLNWDEADEMQEIKTKIGRLFAIIAVSIVNMKALEYILFPLNLHRMQTLQLSCQRNEYFSSSHAIHRIR